MGCGPVVEPPPPPPPEPPPVVVHPATHVVSATGEAVAVEMQFQGVGGLFQGFFTTPELVAKLGSDLGACVASERAVVLIRWFESERFGTITLEADPSDLACKASSAGSEIDVSGLAPLGQALANFRDGVSGRFDVRVASFRTGVRVLSGMNHCALWSGGQYPPDGTEWKPCVDIAGNSTCMEGDRHAGVTRLRFSGEAKESLERCLL